MDAEYRLDVCWILGESDSGTTGGSCAGGNVGLWFGCL